MPITFTVLTTLAVVVASLFEIIPTFLIKSNVPTIATVKPYTPLELAGRDLYIAEGCFNCHSQMIRPFRHETERFGEYSKPGESSCTSIRSSGARAASGRTSRASAASTRTSGTCATSTSPRP
jgi:cbb3-type cytochrome c oxidase subunit II